MMVITSRSKSRAETCAMSCWQVISRRVRYSNFKPPIEYGTNEPSSSSTTSGKRAIHVTMHSPHSGRAALESFRVVTSTTLGSISIELSRAGISRLEFIESDSDNQETAAYSDDLRALVSAATVAINDPLTAPNLPLQLQGTPFQRSVWRYLQTIPAGTTRTYAEIARALGAPRSWRAVANACGANTIAVLIPCHRAIRSDGSYGGYRWGIRRKREILSRESGT